MSDERRLIPLCQIKEAPWNPKIPIGTRYRKGLKANIERWAPKGGEPGADPLRDDLKVWPDEAEPGTFFVLDGNQRLGLLREMEVEAVWCRILADLDLEDAKLFTAAFDRNHAEYDEGKLASLAAELQAKGADLVAKLLRADTSLVRPPDREPEALTQAKAELVGSVPVMFQLTKAGYEAARGYLLKSKGRLKQEERLLGLLSGMSERQVDDLVVELAVRIAAG